ncbi:MAG: septum formation initiator family protein [Megasphaera sp.]|uniref:FtsB family cell division protein n=2 Tax=Megasphaera sp. TaxID=2023260 RepID=UPI0025C526A2|nr:septum formation initiator family protein [Megasphaera sp.]MCF0152605.1 septum formation initiator family protein [Megasphaera sp.]MCI7601045.1 septum formation initiator family protein [Megasphaera sp.]
METKQYRQPGRRKKRRKVPRKRRSGLFLRLRKMSWYNLCLIAIIIVGFYLIGVRLYRLWEIHEDMNQTLQQEQTLRDENLRLRERRDKLNDPDEIAREAREQFGLAKPDEIPYKP